MPFDLSRAENIIKSRTILENDPEYVVTHYSETIYRIALMQVGHKEDAEDILQEIFLTYYRKKQSFNDEEHRKAWLIKVTLNCCKRTFSHRKKHQYVPIDSVVSPVNFEHEEDVVVYEAVMSLPESLKTVISLYYFEGLSAKEICSVLHIRESAVFMRLSRGRALLKQKLGGYCDL